MRVLVRLAVPAASVLAGMAFVALPGGCGRSAPEGPAAVRGRLTGQGQPVAGGTVVFAPDPDRGGAGKPVRADTAADGTFTLPAGPDGVRAGWYRVALAAAPADAGGFPARLARPDRSGLVRQVVAGRDHVFEFAVELSGG